MAHSIASISDGKFGDVRYEEGAPMTATLITVIGVLLKQVLDLRETLAFYEEHLREEWNEGTEAAGCTKSDTPEGTAAFG